MIPALGGPLPCTWLFCPATRPDRAAKALNGPADAVILDLEDAVAADAKDTARQQVREMTLDAPLHRLALRINAPDTRSGIEDLSMLLNGAGGFGWIILPKSESPEIIRMVASLLEEARNPARLIALVESARGLQAIDAVAASGDRLAGIMFGAADAASNLQCQAGGTMLRHARERIVIGCAAAGIAAIDSPSFTVDDADSVAADAQDARQMGFAAKAAIHPAQIEPIARAFRPNAQEIARARKIVELSSAGVATLDGGMIDEAMAKGARSLLERWDH